MALNVLLLATEPGISLQVLFCLEAMGAKTHIVAGARARHLGWSRHCASFHVLPEPAQSDATACAAYLNALTQKLRCDTIIPTGMPMTRLLTAAKPDLCAPTVPLPERGLLNRLDDKFTFAEMLEDLGVPGPKTIFLGGRRQICLSLLEREIGFPLIIKPTNEGNANGVVLCRNRDEVTTRIIQNPHYPYETLIAQEFIPGIDIDLSVLARDGEIIASAVQRRIGNAIHFFDNAAFLESGRRIVAATGFSGVAHFDGRLDERDGVIKLVECNPRFWASITASLWSGVNFVAAAIDAAHGAVPNAPLAVAPQVYVPPTPLLAALLTSPWRRELWSRSNFASLAQVLGNFAPYLAEEWVARTRRLTEQRRVRGGMSVVAGLRLGKG